MFVMCCYINITSVVALSLSSQFSSYPSFNVLCLVCNLNAPAVANFIWVSFELFAIYCKTKWGVFPEFLNTLYVCVHSCMCVCVLLSGNSRSICSEWGPRPPEGRWAAQDSRGSWVQRDGRQGAEFTNLHITYHTWWCRRQTRQLEARWSAHVRQWCGALKTKSLSSD